MDNSIVKKSIFKQKVYRYVYKAIGLNIISTTEFVKENNIHICNLEMPVLKVKEKLYIEELDRIVTITEAIRTSKENILYYIKEEYIEDEISTESKNKEEKKIEEVRELRRKANEETEKVILEELEKAKQQIQNKSFWSRLKDKMSK